MSTIVNRNVPKAVAASKLDTRRGWSEGKVEGLALLIGAVPWLALNAVAVALNWGGWIALTFMGGILVFGVAGILASFGLDWLALRRRARKWRKQFEAGHIIAVSNDLSSLWYQVRREIGDYSGRTELNLDQHFAFVARLSSFYEGAKGTSREVRAEFDERVKAEITAELTSVWERLTTAERFAREAKRSADQIEADAKRAEAQQIQDSADARARQILLDTPAISTL